MPLLPHDPPIVGLAADVHDLRIWSRALVVGMDEDVAEATSERLVLAGVEALVAEEDHAVIE
jgi:hypothetical protein